MFALEGLRAGYGLLPVLHGIDLSVAAGEVVAILGRNGAGKTTLLRTIAGAQPMAAGRISLDGRDLSRFAPFRRARAGIAHVPQGRGIFGRLTVGENLDVGGRAAAGRAAPGSLEAILSDFPVLAGRLGQVAGTLSGGQQQMLAIARALCGAPKLLLLDEPAEGIQPNIVHQIADLIPSLARTRAMGVLLVEQNLDLVRRAASRCLVMEKGRIVHATAPDRLDDEALLKELLAL